METHEVTHIKFLISIKGCFYSKDFGLHKKNQKKCKKPIKKLCSNGTMKFLCGKKTT